jgi:FAD/FMN-containing dehydrogenase
MSLTEALIAALGPDCVRTGADIPVRNRQDEAGYPPVEPLALLLPRDTAGVATALRLCHAAAQPVVVQGGLTGLVGGGQPQPGEMALSLERLRGVAVDVVTATLTAWAGTPLAAVQAAAAAAGLHCGIDLGARGSCTIGGNVATNAGGNTVIRYGMARRNVLGLEVVQPDGTVLSGLNRMLKNNAGYDWTQLYIGSEGTLGVITRVVLALHPAPRGLRSALVALSGVEAALALLAELEGAFAGGVQVFEGMWREFMGLAGGTLGLPGPFAPMPEMVVLIEVACPDAAAFEDRLGALLEAGVIADAILARSEAERARLWAWRESPYLMTGMAPRFAHFDVSIPRGAIAAAVEDLRAAQAAHWPAAPTAIFGHIADSNLHVMIPLQDGDPPTEAVEAAVYAVVAAHAGSVSAEHGIGIAKRRWLPLSRSPAELALMRTLKAALDPRGILNPGRVIG